MRSRFEWGLTADIQPPDVETRLAILRTKAERAGRDVQADILEMIARKVQSNIRELEGALNRVLAFSDLSGIPLTLDLAHQALADFLPQGADLKPDDVLAAVSAAFGISNERLLGAAAGGRPGARWRCTYCARKAGCRCPKSGNTWAGAITPR